MRLPTIFDHRARRLKYEDQNLVKLAREDKSTTAPCISSKLSHHASKVSLEGYQLAVHQAFGLKRHRRDVLAALSESDHLRDLSTPDIQTIFDDLVTHPDHTKTAMDIIFKTEGRGTTSIHTDTLFERFLWQGTPEEIEKAIDIYRDVPHLRERFEETYTAEAVELVEAGKSDIAEALVKAGLVHNAAVLMSTIHKTRTALDSLTTTLDQKTHEPVKLSPRQSP